MSTMAAADHLPPSLLSGSISLPSQPSNCVISSFLIPKPSLFSLLHSIIIRSLHLFVLHSAIAVAVQADLHPQSPIETVPRLQILILALNKTSYTCKARIVQFYTSKGWHYISCNVCKRKLRSGYSLLAQSVSPLFEDWCKKCKVDKLATSAEGLEGDWLYL